MTDPQLYRQLTLLDRDRHAPLRITPVQDWRFVRGLNAVSVTVTEFLDVAREYPIAFVPVEHGADGQPQITPVALLSLRANDNAYVGPDGGWTARYLPAFLRRYPFTYVRNDVDGLSVALDDGWAGYSTTEGERLFDDAGQPSDYLQAMVQLLDRFEEDSVRTRALCARLVQLELLRSGEVKGRLDNGMDVNAAGFFMVDEAKLQALPDEVVLELHRSGALALIHAHLLSMGQVQAVADRLIQRG